MNNNSSPLIKKASDFVVDFFNKNLPAWALYHSIEHTLDTVYGCGEIGAGSGFSGSELEAIIIAGWFHDTGYVLATSGHEEISCKIAEDFLRTNKSFNCDAEAVVKYIMATETTRQLNSLSEFVIRDADLISLGRNDFSEKNNLLKKEIEIRENKNISDKFWLERSIKFLESHMYYTDYARAKYGPGVEKNIELLKKQLEE